MALSYSDGLLAACTILGPILAVQAQKWVERNTEQKNRKKRLFENLMMVRGETLSVDFKRSVNMIEMVFAGDKKVINAWHNLFDTFSEKFNNDTEAKVLVDKRTDFLKILLKEMSQVCGYDFDDRTIAKGYYTPTAHMNFEEELRRVRQGAADLLEGKKSLKFEQVAEAGPVKAQVDFQAKVIANQEELIKYHERLSTVVSTSGHLKVKIDNG
jgi:hypothetical protein